jgi:hypothetical protein
MEQETLKVEHKHKRAGKLATRTTGIAAQNTRKVIQNAPLTKQKVLHHLLSNPKLKVAKSAAAAVLASLEAAPAALPKVNSQGCNIVVPAKYR